MNLQEQVARRRAEKETLQQAAAAEVTAAEKARTAEATRQREAAVDDLAIELSASGLPIHREGEELAFAAEPTAPITTSGFKHRKLQALLDREARRLWTPGDNWLVISCIAGGITLIHLAGFGVIPLAFGLWRQTVITARYKAQVLDRHPELATALAASPA